MLRKVISLVMSLGLLWQQAGLAQVAAEVRFNHVQSPFVMETYRPVHLRYVAYDNLTNNFNLLLDKGTAASLSSGEIKDSAKKLLSYFLVGVTLNDDRFWVNLRPDSPDQIVDDLVAKTEVGKILLEADLQLKKDTAAMTAPDTSLGRKYWDKVYKKAAELFGSEPASIPAITRPWIVPGEVIVRETDNSAYIYKATLKVCLEQDYLSGSLDGAFKDSRMKALNEYASQVVRESIIPELTKLVNNGRAYAELRQVFYSLVMARWFKSRFYGKGGQYVSLIDTEDLTGLISQGNWSKKEYFEAYKRSFDQGEYSFKEYMGAQPNQHIRTYLSGGVALGRKELAFPGGLKAQQAGSPADGRIGTFTGTNPDFFVRLSSNPRLVAVSGTAVDNIDMAPVNGRSSASPLEVSENYRQAGRLGLTRRDTYALTAYLETGIIRMDVKNPLTKEIDFFLRENTNSQEDLYRDAEAALQAAYRRFPLNLSSMWVFINGFNDLYATLLAMGTVQQNNGTDFAVTDWLINKIEDIRHGRAPLQHINGLEHRLLADIVAGLIKREDGHNASSSLELSENYGRARRIGLSKRDTYALTAYLEMGIVRMDVKNPVTKDLDFFVRGQANANTPAAKDAHVALAMAERSFPLSLSGLRPFISDFNSLYALLLALEKVQQNNGVDFVTSDWVVSKIEDIRKGNVPLYQINGLEKELLVSIVRELTAHEVETAMGSMLSEMETLALQFDSLPANIRALYAGIARDRGSNVSDMAQAFDTLQNDLSRVESDDSYVAAAKPGFKMWYVAGWLSLQANIIADIKFLPLNGESHPELDRIQSQVATLLERANALQKAASSSLTQAEQKAAIESYFAQWNIAGTYISREYTVKRLREIVGHDLSVTLTAENGRSVEVLIPDLRRFSDIMVKGKRLSQFIYQDVIAKSYAQSVALGNGPTSRLYVEVRDTQTGQIVPDVEEKVILETQVYFDAVGAPLLSKANVGNRVLVVSKPDNFKAKRSFGLDDFIARHYAYRKVATGEDVVAIGFDVGGRGTEASVIVNGKYVTDEVFPLTGDEEQNRRDDRSLRYRHTFPFATLEQGGSGGQFRDRLVFYVKQVKAAVARRYGKVDAVFVNVAGAPDYANERMASLGEITRGFTDMRLDLAEANLFITALSDELGDTIFGYGNDMVGWSLSLAREAGFTDGVAIITGTGVGVKHVENGKDVDGTDEGGHQIYDAETAESRSNDSPRGSFQDWGGSTVGIMTRARQNGLVDELNRMGISNVDVRAVGYAAAGLNPDTGEFLKNSRAQDLALKVWDATEEVEAQHVISIYRLTGKTQFAFGGGTTGGRTGAIRAEFLQRHIDFLRLQLGITDEIKVTLAKDASGARGAAVKAAQLVEIAAAAAEARETGRSASAATTDNEKLGGIDLRSIKINVEPLGMLKGLNYKLPELSSRQLKGLDLDKELNDLHAMVGQGIVPSGERIKEFVAACVYKKELAQRSDDLLNCLMDVCRLEEQEAYETSDSLKESLVIIDGLSLAKR